MVHLGDLAPTDCRVAIVAGSAGLQMVEGSRSCLHKATLLVTENTLCWSALEFSPDVTVFTIHLFVESGERETGQEMIEF